MIFQTVKDLNRKVTEYEALVFKRKELLSMSPTAYVVVHGYDKNDNKKIKKIDLSDYNIGLLLNVIESRLENLSKELTSCGVELPKE